MEVLTYTLYKEHCDLYTEIHDSIAASSYQIELAQPYGFTVKGLHNNYKTGKGTSIEKKKFIHFNL